MTTGGSAPPLAFVGQGELGSRPHVVADGAARAGTVLTLSHWPASPTPPELARDLSVETAVAYLGAPHLWCDLGAVTNDHLDQDGLAALFVLTQHPASRTYADLLVEVGRVGDFAVVRDERAAAIAFAIARLGDPERTSLVGLGGAEPSARDRWTDACIEEILGRMPELLDRPEIYRSSYEDEVASLATSRRVVERGEARLLRSSRAQLSVVEVSPAVGAVEATRFCHRVTSPLHPAVIHALCDGPRVLVAQGRHYLYYDRYETWVRYTSRRLPLRRDLGPLALRLSDEERRGATWTAGPPGALEPRLETAGGSESSLAVERVAEVIATYLEDAPIAWDPFRRAGALVGTSISGPAAPKGGTTGRGRTRWRGLRRGPPST